MTSFFYFQEKSSALNESIIQRSKKEEGRFFNCNLERYWISQKNVLTFESLWLSTYSGDSFKLIVPGESIKRPRV